MTTWALWDRAIPVLAVIATGYLCFCFGRSKERADHFTRQLRAAAPDRPAGQSRESLHRPEGGAEPVEGPVGETSQVGAGESRAPLALDLADDAAPVLHLRPWIVTKIVHVWPGNDRIEHDINPGCVCAPSYEVVTDEGPRQGLIYTHRALDGRCT